jgi:hypothetical protein
MQAGYTWQQSWIGTLSWELDQTLELPFVLTAMRRALTQATPHICNSEEAQSFYQSAVAGTAADCQCANQHGWQRASLGYYLYREIMAYGQV